MSNSSMYAVNISYIFMFTFHILNGLTGNYVVYPQKKIKNKFQEKIKLRITLYEVCQYGSLYYLISHFDTFVCPS